MRRVHPKIFFLLSIIAIPMALPLLIALPWILIIFLPLLVPPATFLILLYLFFHRSDKPAFKPRIMVVDDEETSVSPLILALKNKGAEVFYLEKGRDLIDSLRASSCDLIFLDSMMPDLTGERTLAEGDKQLHVQKPIPVIFYSSRKITDTPKDLTQFSILDFWRKQDIANLRSRIDQIFQFEFLSASMATCTSASSMVAKY